MIMYGIGCRHSVFADGEMTEAVVLYNNGRVAVAGVQLGGMVANDDFLMSLNDVERGVNDIASMVEDGRYDAFIIIDLSCGSLLARRGWLRRNNALFLIGKEYELPEEYAEFGTCLGSITTVYRNCDIAVLRIDGGEGFVFDAFKSCGYNKMEIALRFPDIADEEMSVSDAAFYFCVRTCDDEPVALDGSSIREKLDGLLNEEWSI